MTSLETETRACGPLRDSKFSAGIDLPWEVQICHCWGQPPIIVGQGPPLQPSSLPTSVQTVLSLVVECRALSSLGSSCPFPLPPLVGRPCWDDPMCERPGWAGRAPRHSRSCSRQVIELCRPLDSRLEHVDFESLFSSLSVRHLLGVFASLLLERRVIFIADKLRYPAWLLLLECLNTGSLRLSEVWRPGDCRGSPRSLHRGESASQWAPVAGGLESPVAHSDRPALCHACPQPAFHSLSRVRGAGAGRRGHAELPQRSCQSGGRTEK